MLRPRQAPVFAQVLLLACTVPLRAQDQPADSIAVSRALALYMGAVKDNDITAVRDAWVSDPVWMQPGIPTVRGRAAFDEYIRARFRNRHVTDVSITVDDLSVSGNLASVIALFAETFQTASGPQTVRGRFLVVWSRQPDGRWKLARGAGLDAPGP